MTVGFLRIEHASFWRLLWLLWVKGFHTLVMLAWRLQSAFWAAASLGQSSLHCCSFSFDFSHSLLLLKLMTSQPSIGRWLLGRIVWLVVVFRGLERNGWLGLLSLKLILIAYWLLLLSWRWSIKFSELLGLSHKEPSSASTMPSDRALIILVGLWLDGQHLAIRLGYRGVMPITTCSTLEPDLFETLTHALGSHFLHLDSEDLVLVPKPLDLFDLRGLAL